MGWILKLNFRAKWVWALFRAKGWIVILFSAGFFFQIQLFRKILSGIGSVSVKHFVGPGLGSNSLQKLSADNTKEIKS